MALLAMKREISSEMNAPPMPHTRQNTIRAE